MRQPQNELTLCKRRSQNLVLVSAALLLSVSIVDGFLPSAGVTRIPKTRTTISRESSEPVRVEQTKNEQWVWYATPDDNNNGDSTWSRAGDRKESRFGVRRRVRSVLEKARNRTGIQNNSEEAMLKTEQTALDVVAEAASIGGLGAVLVDEETGTIDVALDYVAKQNGSGERSKKRKSYSGLNPAYPVDTARSSVKTTPASTPSPALETKVSNPEDELVVSSSNKEVSSSSDSTALDALKADVSAAFALPADPLPFTLPELSDEQLQQLQAGERIQYQSKMAREGSGYVVLDVKAPPYVVWECLLDFESYPETIPTCRAVRLLTSTHLKSGYRAETPLDPGIGREARHYGKPSTTRASFVLSKFRLKIAAVHRYRPHPKGDYMVFTLDKQSKNAVFKDAKGVWHTQANPGGREGYTRVWLLCELKVSKMLPSFIVDYAAKRAMPRATTWLKPQVEAAADLWLKSEKPNGSH